MDNSNEKAIVEVIQEILNTLPEDDIYYLALKNVDVQGMKEAEPISQETFARTFAVAGFAAGIKFALEEIDVEEVESEQPLGANNIR